MWVQMFEKTSCLQEGLYPATSNCESDSYLASIIADSVIMCDEVINTKKPPQQILMKKSNE